MIKNSLINYSLTACVGAEGIAAANVLASFCGMAGTLSGGCTYAFSTLASLYYGEEDRETLIGAGSRYDPVFSPSCRCIF